MFRSVNILLFVTAFLIAGYPAIAAPKKGLSKRDQLDRDLRQYYLTLDQRLFGEWWATGHQLITVICQVFQS